MFDEMVLRQLNEQAHIRAVALANDNALLSERIAVKKVAVMKPPPVFPLSVLARKLMGGPPSLAYFVELLEQNENFKDFLGMVREYLPEYEVNIMAEDLNDRALKFVELFSGKFFPLFDDLNEDFTIGDLLNGIPTQPLGFSYESYHSFMDFRKGYVLALSLIESPWEEDGYADEYGDDEEDTRGGRVVIIEAVRELVGERLASLIPKDGWLADDLHRITDGTEFDGLGAFADWVQCNTGLYHLDATGSSAETGEAFEWRPDEVEFLTDDWLQSADLLDKMHRLALRLEEGSEEIFTKLLALLLDNKEMVIPKEQLPLPLA